MKINVLGILSLLTFGAVDLAAQSADFIVLEREIVYLQTSSTSYEISPWEDDPYVFYAEFAEATGGSFSNLQVSGPAGTLQLTEDGGSWENMTGFQSLGEMNAAITPGTYTYSGTGSVVGAFSFPVNLTTPTHQLPPKITNFDDLQNVDSSQPLTISFEQFTGYNLDGFMDVEVSYWTGFDSIEVWTSADERSDGIPGLSLSTTSVTIPANTLTGSSDNNYTVWLYFASVDSLSDGPAPFTSSQLATLTSVSMTAPITTQAAAQSWAGYDWATQDGWVNTDGFMGWINVTAAPFVWSSSLGKYIYLPESNVGTSGGWAFVPN